VAAARSVSRAGQDAYALESHQKAIAVIEAGRFAKELAPVLVAESRGAGKLVDADEGPRRDTSVEALARLRPAFAVPVMDDGSVPPGTVTASNAPGLADGAAAAVVASERSVERFGLQPLARIVGHTQAEVEPKWPFTAPVAAIRRLVDRTALPLEAFYLIEINEAFAAQVLANGRELDLDWSRLNVNGGAIALDLPIGASGARIIATLLHELVRRQGRFGLSAALGLGGGGSVAMAVERVA